MVDGQLVDLSHVSIFDFSRALVNSLWQDEILSSDSEEKKQFK